MTGQIVIRRMLLAALCGMVFSISELRAAEPAATVTYESVKGQRVFSAGHSFHMFVPNLLSATARAAGITDHVQVGSQSIGGSRVIQHWNRADNTAKKALMEGNVDVLTLSPIYLPDEGIENFVALGLMHNPNLRVLVQEFWLPYDVYQTDYQQKRPAAPDRNSRTGEDLRKMHAEYFQSMDDHVRELNKKFGKQVVFVVPAGQAVIALREKIIAGEAPGLSMQSDLFTDAIGHPTPPLRSLVTYCHFAVIYGKSPVGIPSPAIMGQTDQGQKVDRLLKELAWEAAVQHPLSGVKADRGE